MSQAKTTADHRLIRRWAEERDGHPATIEETRSDGEPGMLRIDFEDGEQDEALERIDWDSFFKKFDEEGLAFLYQEETEDGSTSRFCKFINPENT